MKKRILITCSAKGGVPYWWFASYDKLSQLNHPEYQFEFAVESGSAAINLSRNIAAQAAIDGGYWKLVQIDKDQFWTVEQLVGLVSNTEPIVCGPYCHKKSGPVKWVLIKTPGAEVGENGLLECDFVGTGMLCTEVERGLKHMATFFPERRFIFEEEDGTSKEMTELFPIGLVGPNTPEGRIARIREMLTPYTGPHAVGVGNLAQAIMSIIDSPLPQRARLLGEDYFFSHLARKSGLKIYADMKHMIGHVGDAVYPIAQNMVNEPTIIPTHTLNLNAY